MFPYKTELEVDKDFNVPYEKILEIIWPVLTEERRQRISEVVAVRNFNLTVVLENIFDRGNISAVMRSHEAFGFSNVDIIEGGERFKNANRVSSGAEKWLNIRKWGTTAQCCKVLKDEGYQICVTSLASAKPMREVDWTKPSAIVLGNEKTGISDEILKYADERVIIPMGGFVQSLNISVAGAVSLYHISEVIKERSNELFKLRNNQNFKLNSEESDNKKLNSNDLCGFLNSEEQNILKAHYALKTLDSAPQILKSKLLKTLV